MILETFLETFVRGATLLGTGEAGGHSALHLDIGMGGHFEGFEGCLFDQLKYQLRPSIRLSQHSRTRLLKYLRFS
jgi:hypothetical protein